MHSCDKSTNLKVKLRHENQADQSLYVYRFGFLGNTKSRAITITLRLTTHDWDKKPNG